MKFEAFLCPGYWKVSWRPTSYPTAPETATYQGRDPETNGKFAPENRPFFDPIGKECLKKPSIFRGKFAGFVSGRVSIVSSLRSVELLPKDNSGRRYLQFQVGKFSR